MSQSMEDISSLGYGTSDVQHYVDHLRNAALHWTFVEAEDAFHRQRFIAGSICFVAGIESSIRSTITTILGNGRTPEQGTTLSNKLLRKAREHKLPVHCLIMSMDQEFERKILTNKEHVEIVRIRHDLAHGNVSEYVEKDLSFFTPDCMESVCSELREVARGWVVALGEFREHRLEL